MEVSGVKKCPYCGKEILAVAKKCKHCGNWIEEKNNPIHSHEQPKPPKQESLDKDELITYYEGNEQNNNTSSGRNKLFLGIVIGISCSLIIGGIFYFVFLSNVNKYEQKRVQLKENIQPNNINLMGNSIKSNLSILDYDQSLLPYSNSNIFYPNNQNTNANMPLAPYEFYSELYSLMDRCCRLFETAQLDQTKRNFIDIYVECYLRLRNTIPTMIISQNQPKQMCPNFLLLKPHIVALFEGILIHSTSDNDNNPDVADSEYFPGSLGIPKKDYDKLSDELQLRMSYVWDRHDGLTFLMRTHNGHNLQDLQYITEMINCLIECDVITRPYINSNDTKHIKPLEPFFAFDIYEDEAGGYCIPLEHYN